MCVVILHVLSRCFMFWLPKPCSSSSPAWWLDNRGIPYFAHAPPAVFVCSFPGEHNVCIARLIKKKKKRSIVKVRNPSDCTEEEVDRREGWKRRKREWIKRKECTCKTKEREIRMKLNFVLPQPPGSYLWTPMLSFPQTLVWDHLCMTERET